MTDTRATKAELVARLAEKDALVETYRQAARIDGDAAAIAACVRVLDPLVSSSPAYSRSTPSPSVERVLIYLRHRYGIADATAERDALRVQLGEAQNRLWLLEQQS